MERARLPLETLLVNVSRSLGLLAVLVGLTVAAGWIFDVTALRSLFPGLPDMKMNSAVSFVAAGTAILLLASGRGAALARACAAFVALLGGASLAEYGFGIDLGIDQLLVRDPSASDPFPGRIPLASSLNFLALGLALLFLDLPRDYATREAGGRWPAQWLAVAVGLVALIVVLGFAYDATSLYRPSRSNAVALDSALLFVLLAVATLLARPRRGLAAQLIADDAGGFLLRRLLPAAVLVPPAIGWLHLQGEHAALYGRDLTLAIFATSSTFIFALLAWSIAAAARRTDMERRTAQVRVREQLAKLDLLHHITRAIGDRLDLESVFQVVITSLEQHLPIDFGCVGLDDAAEGRLRIDCRGERSSAIARELGLPGGAMFPVDENGLGRAVRGTLVYEPDISQVRSPLIERLASAGLRAVVLAPLAAESSVYGVLVAARKAPASFTSAECEFLKQLSEHVALAARQAQLHSALQSAYDDLRQSQQTIMQQERLRVIGQMSSGIAHDINNALSPISLYTSSLLERESGLSGRGREQLATIQRAIDDVSQTVARMREFYRPREPQLRLAPVHMNLMVEQVVELTRARWRDLPQERGTVVELRVDLASDLPPIMGAEAEVRDALTNLILNAVDAMPQGGLLTLRTRAFRDGRPASARDSATHVCAEVIDSGIGMDEETRRRCLEPFFTTKGERGTGLGLSMVYGMAKRHSAEVEIDSAPGAGTTMRLVFPVSMVAVDAPPQEATPVQRHRLRMLVVDDDPLLIELLRETLADDGHEVTVADGGQAGIDAFMDAKRRGSPFEVVMTDLGMPHVDGRRVAEAVRAAAPDVHVILLTGWGQRMLSENDLPPGVDRVLAKPPKLAELRAALAAAGSSRASARTASAATH